MGSKVMGTVNAGFGIGSFKSCVPVSTRFLEAAGSGIGSLHTRPAFETDDNGFSIEYVLDHVKHLSCTSSVEGGSCDVYIVGVIHRSLESCQLVKFVIRYVKPKAVFLELCKYRAGILENPNTQSEFRVANEEAEKIGAKVILGDLPFKVTYERIWRKMPSWYKKKFPPEFSYAAGGRFYKYLGACKKWPLPVKNTVLHERDWYMAAKLLEVASEHSSVVAIVGEDHLPGIIRHWRSGN